MVLSLIATTNFDLTDWSHLSASENPDLVMAASSELQKTSNSSYLGLNSNRMSLAALDPISEAKVMIGGHSVGILVSAVGLSVMGHYAVDGEDKGKSFPARQGGVETGDIILSVNDNEVNNAQDLEKLVNMLYDGKTALKVKVLREDAELTLDINPNRAINGDYKLGIYVRDNAAGVGTLTFWDPESMSFGALGHVVTDGDSGRTLSISQGSLILARVAGIQIGTDGHPGEKIGAFSSNTASIGVINQNSSIGIYGKLESELVNPLYREPIPVATKKDISVGPAELLTVIDGNKIESFSCEITKVLDEKSSEGKNLMIKITDPKLLAATGGIIQGMSGSPIVQNGKFIGAVTHVMVSDPTKGYGIMAENMIEAAQSVSASSHLHSNKIHPTKHNMKKAA